MTHIILTATQAERVRGLSVPGHELNPIRLKDGSYILPLRVLDDPAHAAHRDRLLLLPQSDVAKEIAETQAETEAARNTRLER